MYEGLASDGRLYKLTMLSQTSLMLAFEEGGYAGAQVVRNEEELVRFVSVLGFPRFRETSPAAGG
jgi:hypothetical protein